MKHPTGKRLLALALALCAVLGTLPAAAVDTIAPAALSAIQAANRQNNMDYAYDTHTLWADGVGGVARKTFSVPAGAVPGAVYAALLPTDDSGAPQGGAESVRYVRLEPTSGSLSLTYRRDGCRRFAAMLVQPLPDGGEATLRADRAEIKYHVQGNQQSFSIGFTAGLTMSPTLAQIADLNRNDKEKWEKTVFTSHVRLDPALDVNESSLLLHSNILMIKPGGITKNPGGETGFDVVCVLRPDWQTVAPGQTLVQKLQAPMSYTGSATITGGAVAEAVQNGRPALLTLGWNTLGGLPGKALGGPTVQVPATPLSIPLKVTDDLTVEVKDESGKPIANATVTLTLVNNSLSWDATNTTGQDGSTKFPAIPYGTYRIDVRYTTDSGKTHTATTTAIFVKTSTVTIVVSLSLQINTEVVASGGQSASAEGLNTAVTVTPPSPGEDKKATITLEVTKSAANDTGAQDILDHFGATTAPTPGKPLLTDFVDASLFLTEIVNHAVVTNKQPIPETDQLVTVHIPVPDDLLELLTDNGLTPKHILTYRHHVTKGGTKELTQLPYIDQGAEREGYYTTSLYSDGEARHYIAIQAMKFSVYAFGVNLSETGPVLPPGPGPVYPPDPDQPSDDEKYPVRVGPSDGGAVTASHKKADQGTTVTLTVKPDTDRRLTSLQVTDDRGRTVAVTAMGNGVNRFTMPNSGVTVRASFAAALADPQQTGVSDLLNTRDHGAYLNGYPDGRFAPNGSITRAEVAQVFYNLLLKRDLPITVSFTDVPADAWYAPAVNALSSLGIVNGVGGGAFAPRRSITRAEFAAIAARFAKTTAPTGQSFTDVPTTHWAHGYIATASAYGWVNGMGGGLFAPTRAITRAEAATMVNRMLGRTADRAYIDAHPTALVRFHDVAASFWGYYDIMEAANRHDYTTDGGAEVWTPSK